MTLREYIDTIKNKKVAVIGIGVSNTPLIDRLLAEGVSVTACDKRTREQMGAQADDLERRGCRLHLGGDYLDGLDADVIFRTPGLRPDVPQIAAAVAKGAELTSEMEVFFRICPCPIIAVTGSDGKTTTTTIIAELLRAAGKTVWLGGNIGAPLLDQAERMRPEDVAVLELSSFQLMSMEQAPHIAVITNLSPNHLDVHKDMDEYVSAKCNIFRRQGPEDVLVLNYDNELTRALAPQAPGQVRFFSRQSRLAQGVCLEGGVITDDGAPVMAAADIRIPGVHNIENYMAACAALRGIVSPEVMDQVARTFGGVEHRLELVRELDGVSWYNDSIGSSPSRTIAGLKSFSQKVILIAGGYDKHIPFDSLGELLPEHVRLLLLCGATAEKIEAAVLRSSHYRPGAPEILHFDRLDDVIRRARALARPGDIVLFSPACASFDQFPNFMLRGQYFKEQVWALK